MGLCGTFNGVPKDDFTYERNSQETVASEFAKLTATTNLCEDILPVADSCYIHSTYESLAKETCDKLKTYPFSNCHNDIEVGPFIKKCKEEVCACMAANRNAVDCHCHSFSRYARACAQNSVVLGDWRENSGECLASKLELNKPKIKSALLY